MEPTLVSAVGISNRSQLLASQGRCLRLAEAMACAVREAIADGMELDDQRLRARMMDARQRALEAER